MRKFLITMMCIVMVVCFMPTVAWAGSMDGCPGGEDCNHVAQIGTVHYDTVQDAISAAKDGDTIQLIKNAVITPRDSGEDTLSPQISIDGKNITLDLNGFTISNDSTVAGIEFTCVPAMFEVINGAVVTITGNGTINSELGENNSYGIDVFGGTVVVESGSFLGSLTAFQVEKGSLIINGGYFDLGTICKSQVPKYYAKYIVNCIDKAYKDGTANIRIAGGKFVNFDPSANPEGADTSYVIPGYTVQSTPSGTDTLYSIERASTSIVKVSDSNGNILGAYDSLSGAFDVVGENQTITLLKDVQLTDDDKDGTDTKRLAIDNGKTFTIDLGGNTLTGRLNLRHGNVTIKNGSMTNDTQPLNVYGSTDSGASNYSVLTIANDVTVSATENVVCMMNASGKKTYGAVINIAGTVEATGTGNDAAVYVSGNIGNDEIENIATMSQNNVINITGTVTGGNIMAVAMSGQATVNVESTAEVSGSTGIGVKRGILNVVDGATIEANGDKVDPAAANTNGAENTGAAISVTSTYNNHGSIAVNVLGGNVKSVNNSALYVGHSKDGDVIKAFEKGMTISITGGNLAGTEKAVFVSDKIASDNESYPKKFIVGGTFSSDVSAYVADGKYEYAMRNGTYIVQGAEKPAFTTGNYWSDSVGNVYTEMYSAPYVPSTPTDNVTNSGSSSTDNASTNADLSGSTSTSNGTTTSTVDKTTADKIVDKAVENNSGEVVIDATANSSTAASSTTIAQVTIPTETLGAIAEKTEADVTIKTDVAEVKMDNAAAAAVSEQAEGDTVQIIAEKVAEDTEKVEFELKVVCSDGKVISDFNGGNIAVTVALPKAMAEKKVVCVYIDDNGHMSKVEGQKNADGTYTFVTGHFSTYAILAEEEADAAIAEQTEAIKNIDITLSTKVAKTKAGKKGIKLTWKADTDKQLDGVEVFRSVKSKSGYSKIYTTKKAKNAGYYINTKSLKANTKYYYKIRGFVMVDGQKVYTDWSNKGIRTFK